MQMFGLTLGDWRREPTHSSGLVSSLRMDDRPGIYVFSSRCCGMKGMFTGARHTWLSAFDGAAWKTYEITDEETLALQTDVHGRAANWVCFGSKVPTPRWQGPFRSNRAPDGLWFGQAPRLEGGIRSEMAAQAFLARADRSCSEYRFKDDFTLLDNNCSKFLSYLLWRHRLEGSPAIGRSRRSRLIGFRDAAYWEAACLRDQAAQSVEQGRLGEDLAQSPTARAG